MVDLVATRVHHDSEKNYVATFHNNSDGSGEAAVQKIDVSGLEGGPGLGACAQVRIQQIWASTFGMYVDILWDATTDVTAWTIPQDIADHWDFRHFGGLKNPETSGYTGDVMFTTIGHTAADRYSITLACTKEYA